jgi:outer membrane lipoprotein-sorting protein
MLKSIIALAVLTSMPLAYSMDASKRVEALEKNMEGKTFKATATMTVKRDSEERNLKMKMWWKDRKFAFVKVLEPKKDAGTGSLRIKMDLWQYLPKVNRIIRVPSSMMLQSWMGSDFTNDDLVRGGSLSNDYTHKELGKEKVAGHDTVKIECTPKPSAPVVWGKIQVWVREADNAPVKQEFYTEKGDMVKVLLGENFQKFGSHTIPTKLSMKNMKKVGSETVISYDPSTVEFDTDISDDLFTQENLRRP